MVGIQPKPSLKVVEPLAVGSVSEVIVLPKPYLTATGSPQPPAFCAMLEAYFILPKLSATSFPVLLFKGFCVLILSAIFLNVPGATFLAPHLNALRSFPPITVSIPNCASSSVKC